MRDNFDEYSDSLPPPSRQHKPRATVIIATIILILVLVGGGFAVARTIGGGIFTYASTPIPTLLPGENLFYITTDPSWGTVSVDGRIIRLPAIGSTPLQLAPGGHEITWNAAPFPPQRCSLFVPPQENSGSSSCSANNLSTVQSGKDAGSQATVVSFTATPTVLSSTRYASLIRAIRAFLHSLQSTDTVQPGEYYVDLNRPHSFTTANQQLKATLHFQLDANPNAIAPCVAVFEPGQSCQARCYTLCSGIAEGPPPASMWDVYGVVRMYWDYTTLNGQPVALNQPFPASTPSPEYLAAFSVAWDGINWHVADQFAYNSSFALNTASSSCIPMEALIEGEGIEPAYFAISMNELTSVTINGQGQSLYWLQYVTGKNMADGCLGVASFTPDNSQSSASGSAGPAYCLYRFGVLLAVNVQAHHYWPTMPVADAYEQHIVQQLLLLTR